MIDVGFVDMLDLMNEKHERLRQARMDAGFATASAAATALGVTASTYRAHENGQNDFQLAEAEVYGAKFGVSPFFLLTGKAGAEANISAPPIVDSPNATMRGKLNGAGRMIPVYGRAVGGVDGEFEMNGSILYEVMAPPVLAEVRGAYAVAVSGDSMSPRYEDGEVCFVDPDRRVKKGDYVIVQIRVEEDGPLLAYVKKFCRRNSVELVLEQFNPPKELKFSNHNVHTVHYIALAGNA